MRSAHGFALGQAAAERRHITARSILSSLSHTRRDRSQVFQGVVHGALVVVNDRKAAVTFDVIGHPSSYCRGTGSAKTKDCLANPEQNAAHLAPTPFPAIGVFRRPISEVLMTEHLISLPSGTAGYSHYHRLGAVCPASRRTLQAPNYPLLQPRWWATRVGKRGPDGHRLEELDRELKRIGLGWSMVVR
jgi:hypothetical protein